MSFHWRITSRTGEIYEGEEDSFPSPEQKISANTFELFLSDDCSIQAPYGQNIIGRSISLSIPDGHCLAFKRRVRVEMCNGIESITHTYIIAFEKVEQ
jgi:hypothetical protein